MTPPSSPATETTPTVPAATETEATTSESASNSESETSTGVDADTEESVTSEEETEKLDSVAPTEGKKEKWVAVKGQAVQAAPTADTETAP